MSINEIWRSSEPIIMLIISLWHLLRVIKNAKSQKLIIEINLHTETRKKRNLADYEGMTPIAKIEIAIPIPIFISNWDRDRDPDLNLKNHMRSDRDRSFGDRAIF